MSHECSKCGEILPTSTDLSMHNRIVHTPDALFIHNPSPSSES